MHPSPYVSLTKYSVSLIRDMAAGNEDARTDLCAIGELV